MENPGSEIHDWDWEVIPSNNNQDIFNQGDDEGQSFPSSPSSGGDGVIQSDYFSLDYAATAVNDAAATGENTTTVEVVGGNDEGEDGESDSPSWVDPSASSVVGGSRKRSRSPNSSSSSDSSDRYLLSLIEPHSGCGSGFDCKDHHQELGCFEHVGASENVPQVEFHDASGEDQGSEQREEQQGVDHRLSQPNLEEDEKKSVVWWKVPLEVLKYCVLRVSPVWSLSMAAAALMGFVLLRRRYLYKMKRKSQGIKLNVTIDDKKVSQFMSRAERLNEAFLVVKRVPIIRPTLPAPGMASWPVMSLR